MGDIAMKNIDGRVTSEEQRVVRRLLALSIIDGKPQREKIQLLCVAGLDRHEIAELVGTTPLTVSVEISNMRKKGVIRGKKHRS
jgi:CRP-like cAMP-binding protein